MNFDFDAHGYQLVSDSDDIRFDCSNCGDCCRNIKDSVMLESLDLYRLAQFFGVEVSEVILKYTTTVFLARAFPVFMLKTASLESTCIFLKVHGAAYTKLSREPAGFIL